MRVRVMFLGSLAQSVGASSDSLELADNACVADALEALASCYPAVGAGLSHLATAVDHEYVGRGHVLADGCELALIPPVSGG